MADNETALMHVEVGTQTVFGTAVDPTAKLMGVDSCEFTPGVENSEVEEDRGTLDPAFDVTVDKVAPSGKISGSANFEQIGYLLDSLLGTAVPSGAGPYTRTYVGPGAKPTSSILSLLRGSAAAVYGMNSAILNELTLKTDPNTRLKYDGALLGHSVAPDSFAFPALNDVAVNYIHANQMSLYIDSWGSTIGTTAISLTNFKTELGLNMNRAQKMGIGSANPIGIKHSGKLAAGSNQLKMSLELDTASKAWFDAILASATSGVLKLLVRMKYQLSVNNIFQIDYAGYAPVASNYPVDTDGVAQVDLTLNPMYNATLATWLKMVLTNSVAVLP